MINLKEGETSTALTVEVSDTRTQSVISKETRGYIVALEYTPRQVARITRTVKKAISKFIADDIVLIDLTVMPDIGDIALCGIGGRTESLEVYQSQANVIGKVTHKWSAE